MSPRFSESTIQTNIFIILQSLFIMLCWFSESDWLSCSNTTLDSSGCDHVLNSSRDHVLDSAGCDHVLNSSGHDHALNSSGHDHALDSSGHDHALDSSGHDHALDSS